MDDGQADLLTTFTDQDKKKKAFMSLSFPSVPARTAAGGHAGPKRWGAWLIAGVVAVSSVVVLIQRPRLGNA